jgi:hypothetical protein
MNLLSGLLMAFFVTHCDSIEVMHQIELAVFSAVITGPIGLSRQFSRQASGGCSRAFAERSSQARVARAHEHVIMSSEHSFLIM